MQYIIDVGAHVGWYIEQWAEGDEKENTIVFAFEPHPSNANILRHRYVDNPNVIIFPFAVGAQNGIVKLYRADEADGKPSGTGRSSIASENCNVGGGFFEVQMIRLSDFIHTIGIEQYRALKIDTEGSEHAILDDLIENNLTNKFDEILFGDHTALFGKEYTEYESALRWRLSQQFKGDLNLDKRWTH